MYTAQRNIFFAFRVNVLQLYGHAYTLTSKYGLACPLKLYLSNMPTVIFIIWKILNSIREKFTTLPSLIHYNWNETRCNVWLIQHKFLNFWLRECTDWYIEAFFFFRNLVEEFSSFECLRSTFLPQTLCQSFTAFQGVSQIKWQMVNIRVYTFWDLETDDPY